jgi:RND family efflux transporter MFP subunit
MTRRRSPRRRESEEAMSGNRIAEALRRLVPLAVSAAILLAIAGAGAWFYRSEIAAWWSSRKAEPPAADEHAGHGGKAHEAAAQGQRKILFWYDPMHPEYKSDKPGKAPDCGMDLAPMYEDEMGGAEMAPGTVKITPERQRLIGVRTAKVEREEVSRVLRLTGKVMVDETRIAHIHTKYSGYIEHVYADFVGRPVKRGEPLFTIYSPELVAAQQEYLVALRAGQTLKDAPYGEVRRGAEDLVKAARERLRLWDVREEEMEWLEREGTVKKEMTVYSPAQGVITERAAFHHGRYVTPELDLFVLADLSSVWVIADVFPFEAPYVRPGQPANVRFTYFPGRNFRGRVGFILPDADPKTRAVRVRIELPNPKLELKPEMFADVELAVGFGTQIVVPQEAVLDSGLQKTVFVVHEGGFFEPRVIEAGPPLPGYPAGRSGTAGAAEKVVVRSGLKAGETIVTSANFLVDSESRLKSAIPGGHASGGRHD